MAKYDVAILGGGPGGYVAAIRASQLGLKTCVVEKGLLGGTCLNRGCIPTKALLHAASLLEKARNAHRFGLTIKDVGFSLSKVMERKAAVVKGLRQGVELLLDKRNIEVIRGEGKFVARNTIQVETKEGITTVKSDKAIVATGSEPLCLPFVDFDGKRFLSSTDILVLRGLPKSLLIVGGGYVGCEFATAFAALGVEVTILEMTDQLLPGIDSEVTKPLQRQMAKKGVKLHFGSKVTKAYTEADEAVCELSSGDRLSAEKALIAVGRKLNSDGIGLEEIGVEMDKGAIVVDEHMQTSVAGTYAVGDVVNKGLLAHIAHHQGIVAAENAAGGSSKMDYGAIPFCVYTVPEIAAVGLNREQAEERKHEVTVGRFPFAALGKAVIEGHTDGFAQVVADAVTGEILGAQIVGLDATNLISEAVALIKGETTLDELCHAIHPHPTLPEALMEAALDAKGQGIHLLSSRSKR